jgi:hypothetical protein
VDDNKINPFDDLFEPFELDETPPDEPPEVPLAAPEQASVVCPSCGTHNATDNRHCEACGARLGKVPMPVAPPPMVRATPGGRALGILAAVVLIVALAALIWNFVSGDDTTAEPTTTTTPTTTVPLIEFVELQPFSVTASSELSGFEASHLIDGDSTTYWNDEGLRGVGASLTFTFQQPVQISEIRMLNLQDEEKFARNFRIKGVEITTDDLAASVNHTLENGADEQVIRIPSLETTVLTIRVLSTYPAEAWTDPDGESKTPFDELALQAVSFFGRVAPSTSG